jgi:carbamoyl-phosphate synthase/aspartate carbamoyltransferase
MALEVQNDDQIIRFCEGRSFGAHRSVAGELVFQTGMVGYPESITDPSYRGQILVITFPLVGNYGVPPRDALDPILGDVPAHFEASEIHIAGLVVASYCGEDYSHHLASSSLGQWLKEQNVPAVCGVDTRALTKKIREKGSMLGRLLMQTGTSRVTNGTATGAMTPYATAPSIHPANLNEVNSALTPNGINGTHAKEVAVYEDIEFSDPNSRNLVADGKLALPFSPSSCSFQNLILLSFNIKAKDLFSTRLRYVVASSVWSCCACLVCRCRAQIQPIEMSGVARC